MPYAGASRLDAHEGFIVGIMEQRKDIGLNKMMERLLAEPSGTISRSALSAWRRGRLWDALDPVLDAFTRDESTNHFEQFRTK